MNSSEVSYVDYRYVIALQHIYMFKNRPIREVIRENFSFLSKCTWDEFLCFAHNLKTYKYDKSKREFYWDEKFTRVYIEKCLTITQKTLDYLAMNNMIHIVNEASKDYPRAKLSILKDDAPVHLYILGNKELLNYKSVAVIGTRTPDDSYKAIGIEVSSLLAKSGFNIVSGLALGCDTLAHIGALNASGYTVAVLANGLEKIYPKENSALAQEILEKNGCLVTEYPPMTKIEKWFFPQRDRLQAAFSEAIFVISTGQKGGTMITVDYAIKQNKKVYTFIPLVSSEKSNGNSYLIKESKAEGFSTNQLSKIPEIIHLHLNENVNNKNRKILTCVSPKDRTAKGLAKYLIDMYVVDHQPNLFSLDENNDDFASHIEELAIITSRSNEVTLDHLLDDIDEVLLQSNNQLLNRKINELIKKWQENKMVKYR